MLSTFLCLVLLLFKRSFSSIKLSIPIVLVTFSVAKKHIFHLCMYCASCTLYERCSIRIIGAVRSPESGDRWTPPLAHSHSPSLRKREEGRGGERQQHIWLRHPTLGQTKWRNENERKQNTTKIHLKSRHSAVSFCLMCVCVCSMRAMDVSYLYSA